MFKHMIHWCKFNGFPWKIFNEHFFWLTNYQTGELDENNHIKWHDRKYFTII